jgi:hypothetical protein
MTQRVQESLERRPRPTAVAGKKIAKGAIDDPMAGFWWK